MSVADRLPDFIVVGAAKCGTTTLYGYLCLDPRVFMSTPKEPCFFDEKGSRGDGIGWYRGLFADAREGQILGEASTNYTRYPQVPDVPAKIHALIPEARLIFLMRDPVQRTYSHFVHRWARETHPGEPFSVPFREYVEQDRMCIDSSDYALQLDQYMPHFDRSRLLLLTFEQFMSDRAGALRQLGDFLGLDGLERFAATEVHEGDTKEFLAIKGRGAALSSLYARAPWLRRVKGIVPHALRHRIWEMLPRMPWARASFDAFRPPPLSADDRAWLAAYFEPRNRDLAARYGVDISRWTGTRTGAS